jgi:hypothetical protein
MSILSTFANTLTGGASGLAVYAIVFALGSGVGAYGMHRWDAGAYESLVAANAQAQTLAVQKAKDVQSAIDKVTLDAAVAEAKAQQQILVQHDYITQEVTKYVPVHVTCITVGLVRLLDAASLGTDPANSTVAPGQSDDACTSLTARQLASNIINNYAVALANAEQLNALEAWVSATVAASTGQ